MRTSNTNRTELGEEEEDHNNGRSDVLKLTLLRGFSEDGSEFPLKKVTDTYEDIDDYVTTYEALLFEEVKAHVIQLQNKKEEVWAQKLFLAKDPENDARPSAAPMKEEILRESRFCKAVLKLTLLRGFSEDGSEFPLKKVKDTYEDIDDYVTTYEALLFEEVKAHVIQLQNKTEEVSEWSNGYIHSFKINDGFHLPVVRGSFEVSQNDLIILSDTMFAADSTEVPTTCIYTFALVECHVMIEGGQGIKLRMYLGEGDNPGAEEKKFLEMRTLVTRAKTRVNFLKICNLSTIFREYVAVRSVGSLPFKDLILKAPRETGINQKAWRISGPLKDFIRDDHNESQQGAIHEALSGKPFVLIQGPPGTGKTKTILGLLSVLLHATPMRSVQKEERTRALNMPTKDKYAHWNSACPWIGGVNPRDELPTDGGNFPVSGYDSKPERSDPPRNKRVRVLVCAPSNNALDVIVLQVLSWGVRNENNEAYNPTIVRVGMKPHHSVERVSIDKLVEQKWKEHASDDKHLLYATTCMPPMIGGNMDFETIRANILDEAAIVFSTLGSSGAAVNKLNGAFDVVIIDEAAQAVEPSSLVPLVNGCKQVILVGDPEQLPATVISPVALKFGYGRSLFERFQRAGYEVKKLQIQYRMHPEIRSFPSKEFYHDALKDWEDIVGYTKRNWHRYKCFGPFCFFDIHQGIESERSGKGSWVNEDEVEFVIHLHEGLVSSYTELKSRSQLAIISPYKHQVRLLRERFEEKYGKDYSKIVDINTVDGFQGREMVVAIFSCVRANKDGQIGFLSDYHRMNVGITRAKSSFLVVGSASTLSKGDEHWKNLVKSAETVQRFANGETKTVNCLLKVDKPYAAYFRDDNLDKHELQDFVDDEFMMEPCFCR
ncbi:hypothetical protein QQ045_013299 [Rhodiola kirilowii]